MVDLFVRIADNDATDPRIASGSAAEGVMSKSICFQPSCMPVGSRSLRLATRRRFHLTSVGLFVGFRQWPPSGHRDGRRWRRRSPHPWCQRMIIDAAPTGRPTRSGAPRRSSGSDSIWLTTMRARLGSKRSAKIERRGNVSLRASARTAPESPEACLRSKPSVSARPLTQVAGLRKGSGNASTIGRHRVCRGGARPRTFCGRYC